MNSRRLVGLKILILILFIECLGNHANIRNLSESEQRPGFVEIAIRYMNYCEKSDNGGYVRFDNRLFLSLIVSITQLFGV